MMREINTNWQFSVAKTLGVVIAGGMLSLVSFSITAQETASQQPVIHSDKVADSLLQDVVRAGDRLVAVGERGHVAYSDDNGQSWKQAEDPTRSMLNAVYFVSPDTGWAVGHDGLVLKTTDSGQNWSIQLDGLKFTRKRMADNIPVLEQKIAALEVDKDAAEKQMDDAESTAAEPEAESAEAEAAEAETADLSQYEDLIADLDDKISLLQSELDDAKAALTNTVANPLMDVWFRDASTGFAVGAFGEFLMTTDAGESWVSVADRLDNEDKNHLNAIIGKGDLMYIVGEAGRIYRSTNGGKNWLVLESPDPENGSFFAVNIFSDNQIFIAGLRGAMYRSNDGGSTWKQVQEDLHKNLNSIFLAANDTVLVVGNDGAFLRSRDGGRTFLSNVRKDRMTLASVVEAANGSYVVVGAGGVEVIGPDSITVSK